MLSRGKYHFPQHAGDIFCSAVQDTISLLYSKGTLLAHFQVDVHQEPHVLFCRVAFQLCGPQHVLVHGVLRLQV